jgi:hypothetical protein
MTYDEFILSIENDDQPPGMSIYLLALWWDAKGDWRKAHSLVDDLEEPAGCGVHAYLHRKEGDISNADYWYRKAQRQRPAVTLQEEWQMLVTELLTA